MIRLLGGLVEHFADAPRRVPAVRDGELLAPTAGSPEAAALAVQYVSGMTDRFALGLGRGAPRMAIPTTCPRRVTAGSRSPLASARDGS